MWRILGLDPLTLKTQIEKVQVNSISYPSFHLQLTKLIDIKSLKIYMVDITIESYACFWGIAPKIHLIKILCLTLAFEELHQKFT
jgi:hypothetical protein